ncbi:MAG: hypothetical protein JSU03_05870 [Bacteroidetes bacterium]|nr:hypothetical protein [Bacteroidota bacterium]MBS1756787.1 hypothetical protein [Bacteroidota bacterium]
MYLLEFNFQYVEVLVMLVFAFLLGLLIYEFQKMKTKLEERAGINNEGMKLKLQALERLTLYAERAGLQSLVTRTQSNGITTAGYHLALIDTLRSEYEYNVTQQVYVSPEVWGAVSRLKDQNIYIINQLAALLPADATANDFSKKIIEYSLTENPPLNVIVLDALRFEAKKALD